MTFIVIINSRDKLDQDRLAHSIVAQFPRHINDKISNIFQDEVLAADDIKVEHGTEKLVVLRITQNSKKFNAGDEIEISPNAQFMQILECKVRLAEGRIRYKNWIVAQVNIRNMHKDKCLFELGENESFGTITLKK